MQVAESFGHVTNPYPREYASFEPDVERLERAAAAGRRQASIPPTDEAVFDPGGEKITTTRSSGLASSSRRSSCSCSTCSIRRVRIFDRKFVPARRAARASPAAPALAVSARSAEHVPRARCASSTRLAGPNRRQALGPTLPPARHVTVSHPILSRLETGRPLCWSAADPAASLRARGVALSGAGLGGAPAAREPTRPREHYHQEIIAGVDVLCALTADTIPRASQQIGMTFRAAALTGCAVDLGPRRRRADAAARSSSRACSATSTSRPPPRIASAEELGTHAARLAAAGCELILARGFGCPAVAAPPRARRWSRIARRAAVVSGAATQLPTWAVIAVTPAASRSTASRRRLRARRLRRGRAGRPLRGPQRRGRAFAWLDRARAVPGRLGVAPGVRRRPSTPARHGGRPRRVGARRQAPPRRAACASSAAGRARRSVTWRRSPAAAAGERRGSRVWPRAEV